MSMEDPVTVNPRIDPTMPAIDWQQSLQLAQNKATLAEELLKMYVADLPQAKTSINTAFEQQDYEDLRSHVHKLHGGSCYCGVPKVKILAATLEATLKRKTYDPVRSLVEQLNEAIDAVLAAYQTQNFRDSS